MGVSAKEYVEKVIEKVKAKNPGEKEFVQAVEEVLTSLTPFIAENPQYIQQNILERIVEPERQIIFRVPWEDDNGNIQVNRGFRVEFNGVIG
ncbi:Glu/Leu/Phe/Val dehydrogenase dimerization domain-containing protein, partial [Fusobacterium ulcerans]